MSREVIHEARVRCDGCGYAALESTADHIEQAFETCGWVHTKTHHGQKVDYCPVCRRDSPFEAIQRVRELLEPYVPCPSHDDDCDSVICALRLALGLPLDGDGDE